MSKTVDYYYNMALQRIQRERPTVTLTKFQKVIIWYTILGMIDHNQTTDSILNYVAAAPLNV